MSDEGFKEALSSVLGGVFVSPNESDRNLEPANIVDGLFAISRSINRLAKAVEAVLENKAVPSN